MSNMWDAEKQSWDEYKATRFAGQQGIGQSNSQKNSHGRCDRTQLIKKDCHCTKCRNRRNRAKGRTKQNIVRKKLNIPSNRFHGADAHEENWIAGFRAEVKAGKQIQPLATAFYKAKAQSDANHKSIGSQSKPFIHIAMPDGTTNGIISFELNDVENVCVEILTNFGYTFGRVND
jgi:hypothetical protein